MKSLSVAFLALAIASARAAPALINLEGVASPGANGASTSSDDIFSAAGALSPGANTERAIPIVGDLLVGAGIVTAAVANPVVPQPISAVASPGNIVGGVVNTVNGGTIAQRSLIDLSNAAAPGSNTNPVAGVVAPQLGLEGNPFGELSHDLLDAHGVLSPGQNTGFTAATAAEVRPKKRDLIDLTGVLAPGSNTDGVQQLTNSLLNGVGALSPGQNTGAAGSVIPITGANPIAQPVVVPAVTKRGLVDLDGVLSPGIDNPKGTLAEVYDTLVDGTNALSPGANTDAVASKRNLIDLSSVLSPGAQNVDTLNDALLEGQNALSPGASASAPVSGAAKRNLIDLGGVLSPGAQNAQSLDDALLEGQNALSPGSSAPVAAPVVAAKRNLIDLSGVLSPGGENLQALNDALLEGQNALSPGSSSGVPVVPVALPKRNLIDLSNAAAPGSNTNVVTGTLEQVGDALLNGAGVLSPGQNTVDASQPSIVVPATMIKKRDLPIPVVGALTGAQAPAEILAALDGLVPLDAITNSDATVENLAPGIAALPAAAVDSASASKRQIQGVVDVMAAPFIGETGSLTAVTRVPLQAPVDAVLQAVPVPGVHRKRSQASKRFDGFGGSLLDIHGAGSPGADTTVGDASTALINAENVLAPGAGANTKGPLDGLSAVPGLDQIIDLKGSLAAGNTA